MQQPKTESELRSFFRQFLVLFQKKPVRIEQFPRQMMKPEGTLWWR